MTTPNAQDGELLRLLELWFLNHGNSIEDEDYNYDNEPFMVSRELISQLEAHTKSQVTKALENVLQKQVNIDMDNGGNEFADVESILVVPVTAIKEEKRHYE